MNKNGNAMPDQPPLFTMPQAGLTTDDYYTPKWIFDALAIEFDLDVACPPGGPAHTPCRAYYTQADDGLTSPWYGTIWMNPPYSKPAPWVDRFLEHNDGIALLPYSKSKWLQKLWDSDASLLYVYRIIFERADMRLNNSTPFPLGIWAVGNKGVTALKNAGLGKVR